MKTQSIVSVLAVALLAVAWGCSSIDHRLGVERADGPQSFVAASNDAGDPDSGDASRPWVEYCPSSECPAGWGKCRSDQFECEIDFSSDPSNCGECGRECPLTLANATTACAAGTCRLQCKSGGAGKYADCNGYVDDGCEVRLGSNENCHFCGDVCPPDTPCIVDPDTGEGKCGCDPGLTLCDGRACVDLETDPSHCGACGNACDPTNGTGTLPPPDTFYGCQNGTCAVMCARDRADCDLDLENGCETDLTLDVSCGKCDVQCPAGTHCLKDTFGRNVCGCPDGWTDCGGKCVDLKHGDRNNCGACGRRCSKGLDENCMNGTCVMACDEHHADCNGSLADGCEKNIWSDPHNCGGCGVECPGAGQACVFGKCALAPCDQTPETAR